MAKRRKPGGGRKPKADKKVLFTIRLLPHVLAELRAQAETWQGGSGNVSAFTEALLDRGLRERAEEKRDPALKALLYFIAQIAEWSGGFDRNENWQKFWRTDKHSFRTFKIAVHGLLDLIEEPPENPLARDGRARYSTWTVEDTAETILRTLWMRAVSERYANQQLERFRGTVAGQRMEREVYGLTQAVRDLELKPKTTKPGDKGND